MRHWHLCIQEIDIYVYRVTHLKLLTIAVTILLTNYILLFSPFSDLFDTMGKYILEIDYTLAATGTGVQQCCKLFTVEFFKWLSRLPAKTKTVQGSNVSHHGFGIVMAEFFKQLPKVTSSIKLINICSINFHESLIACNPNQYMFC